MNYKKVLPAVALTLGVTAQLAAHAELFQMTEVSGHGLLAAAPAADDKCGAGSCGAAKANEKKDAAEHQCGADKKGEHKCGADKKGEHQCGTKKDKQECSAKKAEHQCGSKKAEQKSSDKKADHKCASSACCSAKKSDKH
jgi:uncharacterized low-complexity protein